MNTVVLAIILISGYLYVTRSVSSRYKFKRADGWDSYFYIAAWGILFSVLSWSLCSFLNISGFFQWLYALLITNHFIESNSIKHLFPLSEKGDIKLSDIKFFIFGILSIAISWGTGRISEWYVYRSDDRRINSLIKAVSQDPMESMLIEAAVRKFPIIITLCSRKFYVGFVDCPKFEHGKTDYLCVIPLLSGYRDKDDQTIKITTNYKKHYIDNGILSGVSGGQITLADFRTLVPRNEVESISFFDIGTYLQFKKREENDKQSIF